MSNQAATASLTNRDSNSRDFVPKDASYTSFSGTDIIPIIYVPTLQGNIDRKPFYVIGEIQTISYSIHRDKIPVKAFGFKSPKGFSRGGRVLAGSLVFAVFDRHVFYDILQDLRFYSTGNDPKKPLAERSLFSDDLPPFDVLIHASNESGHQSNMLIRGVTIVDEGKVMSVEDIYTECTMSYFARDIEIFGPGDNFPEIAKNLIDTTIRQDVLPVDRPVLDSEIAESTWNVQKALNDLVPLFNPANDTNSVVNGSELLVQQTIYDLGIATMSLDNAIFQTILQTVDISVRQSFRNVIADRMTELDQLLNIAQADKTGGEAWPVFIQRMTDLNNELAEGQPLFSYGTINNPNM